MSEIHSKVPNENFRQNFDVIFRNKDNQPAESNVEVDQSKEEEQCPKTSTPST